jgi:hypothetical protein
VIDFFEADDSSRAQDRENRIQRYAKFRQWTEGKDWPWEDCSDVALPDMTTASLRTQDTLHNAVLSGRPPVTAQALHPGDEEKQRKIDTLLDFQFFSEQGGERIIEEITEAFVNDGVFTAYIPWVKEERQVSEVKVFAPGEEGVGSLEEDPATYFEGLLRREFDSHLFRPTNEGAWDWEVFGVENTIGPVKVSFYTRGPAVEMVIYKNAVVFDGPKVIVKDYEDVLHPPRAANLQMPGPSNPDGAAHVILVDHPTIDEIKRLHKHGFYDLVQKRDIDELDGLYGDRSQDAEKQQKDALQGEADQRDEREVSHRRLTRYMCFDSYDIDGDGIDEDMIWWVLRENSLLLKAKRLRAAVPVWGYSSSWKASTTSRRPPST